jgi:hypothetical protein
MTDSQSPALNLHICRMFRDCASSGGDELPSRAPGSTNGSGGLCSAILVKASENLNYGCAVGGIDTLPLAPSMLYNQRGFIS